MDPITYVEQLHATVDQLIAPLQQVHADSSQCAPGCTGCCLDDLTVLEVEAEVLRRHCAEALSRPAHPPGACALLDEQGRCRVYAHRPYVCRTQGLPLRWAEEVGEEVVERRDVCELNLVGQDLTALPAEAFWTLGPVERRLAMAQDKHGQAEARVALRSLVAPS